MLVQKPGPCQYQTHYGCTDASLLEMVAKLISSYVTDRPEGAEPRAGWGIRPDRLVPNSDPVKDLVELNKFGEVEPIARERNNVAGLFAAGDVSDVAFKQIIIAMGNGANAALGALSILFATIKP